MTKLPRLFLLQVCMLLAFFVSFAQPVFAGPDEECAAKGGGAHCAAGLGCVGSETVVGDCTGGRSCCKPTTFAMPYEAECTKKGGTCAAGFGCVGAQVADGFCDAASTRSCCVPAKTTPAAPGVVKPYSAKSFVVPNPLGANADILTVLSRVIQAFLGLVGAFSLLIFVYAGVRYMTAAGDEKTVAHAKDTLKNAFLGLFIIIFAYAIANFFFQTLIQGAATPTTSTPTPTLPTIPK